jgi:hypothetical protein
MQPVLTTHPRAIVVAAQSLLYISLFTTLLAALLAVFGKQWVMYYEAAGSRGTIEQRGLERQRKLDSLHRWNFDMLLQTFPLLLQLALFLFSAGLSIYVSLDCPPYNCRYCDVVDVLRIRRIHLSTRICRSLSRFSVSKSACTPRPSDNPNHARERNYQDYSAILWTDMDSSVSSFVTSEPCSGGE